MTAQPRWLSSLQTILDAEQIDTAPDHLAAYAVDGQVPVVIVYPQTFDQVAALLRLAQGERLAVLPRGSGTKSALGGFPLRADIVLCTGRLNRISEYDAANLTLTGEAGVTISHVSRMGAGHLQTLPLQYPFSAATLGGSIATNAYNPKRLAYGGVGDLLLGMRVALPSGEIAHFGGKVVKNVAGYDMCKLFLGSLGSLGVILEATFKLYALPERDETLLAAFPSQQQGADAAAHLLGTQLLPSQVLLLNSVVAGQIVPPLPADIPAESTVLLMNFEGMDEAVERQLAEMSQVCREQGAHAVRVFSGDAQLQLRQRLEAAITPSAQPSPLETEGTGVGEPARETTIILRLGTVPSRVHTVMEGVGRLLTPVAPQAVIIGDCGVGLVRVCVRWPAELKEAVSPRLANAMDEIPSLTAIEGGYMVVEAAPRGLKETLHVWGQLPSAYGLLKALKARFDPQGILNPGRFVGGL